MGPLGLLKHSKIKRHAGYLCEDLTNCLEKLLDSGELDEYQAELAKQAIAKAMEVSGLDIGVSPRLNEIQYLLSEIQLDLWIGEEINLLVQHMIDEIQEHLDSLVP